MESARDVAAGLASSEDAVRGALDRLERWQPVTNAFSQVYADEALEESRREHRGVLAGVPVAVKDLFDVTGRETTGCSEAYRGNVAAKDAPVVAALREAGAVVIGKTNMHELAFGATNLISACGPTHNPWDSERITGGSSGGSGAAVASRVVPIALGTDTGGSIRIPSSFCGVFGLKPTHGRLSLEGVMPLAVSLDCPGPMAWSAGDLALAWEALTGEPPSGTLPARVGVLRTERATDDVLGNAEGLARDLASSSKASLSDVPDWLAGVADPWLELTAPEFREAHPQLQERRGDVHPFIAGYLDFAQTLPREQLEDGHRRAGEIRGWFEEQFRDLDVLVMPTTPYPAPRAVDESVSVRSGELDVHLGGASTFTRAVNIARLPSLAVPSGLSQGLPTGAQLVGPRGSEAALLTAAYDLELVGQYGSWPLQLPDSA